MVKKSDKILWRLKQLEEKKEQLEKELKVALEAERSQKIDERAEKIINAIHEIEALYFTDADASRTDETLSHCDFTQINRWLDTDVLRCLKASELKAADKLREIISKSDSDVDFDKCLEETKIRLDFDEALNGVENGCELSEKLRWGFSRPDLMRLMELHKDNKHRQKIEELLTDCNFHTECEMLSDGKYDDFEEYVNG